MRDCGTMPAYWRHKSYGQVPCEACKSARRVYDLTTKRRLPCVDCGEPHDPRRERCDGCARIARKQEFCKRGHARTPDNVKPNGNCRECIRTQRAGAA